MNEFEKEVARIKALNEIYNDLVEGRKRKTFDYKWEPAPVLDDKGEIVCNPDGTAKTEERCVKHIYADDLPEEYAIACAMYDKIIDIVRGMI